MTKATGWRSNAASEGEIEAVHRHGCEYLRFPIIALREMVYKYPEIGTKEYLPREHIAETVETWDGIPLAVEHPDNRERSVRDPEAYLDTVLGAVHNPQVVDGDKLRVDGLVDVEKAEDLGGDAAELVGKLRSGEEVSVSAGYGTLEDTFESGQFEGESYGVIQGPPLPDHLAIFPSDSEIQARCSPADGCAAPRANASTTTMSETRANGGNSTVFPDNKERENAVQTILSELPDVGPGIRNNDDVTLLTLAQGVGYSLPGCDCEGACDCERNNAERSINPNMAGVPGQMNRNYDHAGERGEDAEEYPAGGRRAWEHRQVGLNEETDEPGMPAGGRSAWEERKKRNARRANETEMDSSDVEQGMPAGGRSAWERRNAAESDPPEYLTEKYPLTAKRMAQEEREKRKRREKLKEMSKRTDPRSESWRPSND